MVRMFRLMLGISIGYVLGAKAGRARYEQIARVGRALRDSQVTRAVVDAGRNKIAASISTQPQLEPLHTIDEETTILVPHEHLRVR
ncbi:hypothetical protein SMNI109538_01840 [Smaragdicoccus niigatensis]